LQAAKGGQSRSPDQDGKVAFAAAIIAAVAGMFGAVVAHLELRWCKGSVESLAYFHFD
jgi:hypothetical protein